MDKIKITIAETAKKHGLKNAFALQKALNISPTIAARLWKGNFDKIGINTLESLCDYFKCQPNEFFRYTGETAELPGDVQAVSPSAPQDAPASPLQDEPVQCEPGTDSAIEPAPARLSTSQAAKIIGLSSRQTRRLAESGKPKGERNARGEWSFLESDLIEYQNK